LDTTVQVRQADSGSRTYSHAGHTGPVHAVAWSPGIPSSPSANGWRIASASGAAVNADVDNTVQIWNALSGDDLLIYRDHFYFVNAVAWSPDGRKIASASADTNVQVWNVASGSNILTYRGHSSKVNAVAWSPNGKRIASASDDRTVQIWDATTGETIFTYRGHTKEVSSVAWSPNGTRIASAGYDATVHVWNVE
jgi:WD40 repeat protein